MERGTRQAMIPRLQCDENCMTTIKSISQWLLAVPVVFAGAIHFISPNFFLKIMPPYLPLHLELVYLSGVFEMVLGICLLSPRS
jgi:uncharacterized membrane protein